MGSRALLRILSVGGLAALSLTCDGGGIEPPAELIAASIVKIDLEPDTLVVASLIDSLRVEVRDAQGNPVPGAKVEFYNAPDDSSFIQSPLSVLTDANGRARVRWQMRLHTGYSTIHAKVGDVQPLEFRTYSKPDSPSRILFGPDVPIDVTSQGTLPPILVRVVDGNFNFTPVGSFSVSVRLMKADKDVTDSVKLRGTLIRNTVNGEVTFDGLSVDLAGSYRLSAHVEGFSTSGWRTVNVAAGPPASLAFTPGVSAFTGCVVEPAIVVNVLDAVGNKVSGAHAVSLSLEPNASDLSGRTSASTTAGAATFDSVKFASAGTVRLVATHGSVPPVAIEDFTVSPTEGCWTRQPDPAATRVLLGAGVAGSRLYLAGGSPTSLLEDASRVVEAFDASTRQWSAVTSLTVPRMAFSLSELAGGLYAVGGAVGVAPGAATIERYAGGTWTTLAPVSGTNALTRSVAVGGRLYMFRSGASAQVYDPVTDSWSDLPMPRTRSGIYGVAALGGRIYVVGGGNFTCEPANCVDVYDPVTNSWSSATPLPIAAGGVSAAVFAGKLFVSSTSPRAFYAFDPATNEWTRRPNPPQIPHLVSFDGALHAIEESCCVVPKHWRFGPP